MLTPEVNVTVAWQLPQSVVPIGMWLVLRPTVGLVGEPLWQVAQTFGVPINLPPAWQLAQVLHLPVDKCAPVNGKFGCIVSYSVHSAASALNEKVVSTAVGIA